MNRRDFIRKTTTAGLVLGLAPWPLTAFAKNGGHKLTILHTNDTHSRIEPFPVGSRYEGLGGFARRATLIDQVRAQEENVLLLDAGDIFQGTPYFNKFGGELEFKLMSEMKYDAATLGNHDFDAGIDGLIKQMPLASFPFLNANYDFSQTALSEKVAPHKIIKKGKLEIGIFGVGIELNGLVPDALFGDIVYNDPIGIANETAKYLSEEKKCDLVICLSHLGYKYDSSKVSDVVLAENTEFIDIILGGHTHTFMDKPVVVNNLKKEPVVINQVGWAGIVLGRLDLYFSKVRNKHEEKIAPVIISEKTIVK